MIATDFTEALHEMLIGFRYVRCVLVFYVYCTSVCDLRKLYRICSFGNICLQYYTNVMQENAVILAYCLQ